MRNMDGALLGCALLVGASLSFSAEACSTDGWLGGVDVTNALADSPPTVSRWSEFCALSVIGQSYVQSDFASDTRYRARFYFFDGLGGSGDVKIFEAYSDEGAASPLFQIRFDGSLITFDATAAGGNSASVATVNGWNWVEFDWNSDAGTFDLWVNADATTVAANDSGTSGSGTVEAVRLGAPSGLGDQVGYLNFDAFESHRTTPVGPLSAGDANNDGNVNTGDIGTVITEFFNGGLATGQPDCNGDGNVNTGDIGCIITIFFSS